MSEASKPEFAARVRTIEARLGRDPVYTYGAVWTMIRNEYLRDLVTCIREQQAALKQMAYVFDSDDSPSPAIKNARATLAKWRIE